MANRVTLQTYEQRIETCQNSCHLWQASSKKCIGCGCLMLTKARWMHAVCPLGKWPEPAAES